MNIIKQMKDTAEKQERLRRRVDVLDMRTENTSDSVEKLMRQALQHNRDISNLIQACGKLKNAIYGIGTAVFVIGCAVGTGLAILI